MSRAVAFAYAGARAQAHYGQLLSEGQWERLERVPDFALFVQTARDTALRPWVANLDRGTPVHAIEASLRAQFRLCVRAVAHWAPVAWRPALRGIESLPDLPAAFYLFSGLEAHPWISADPLLRRLSARAGLSRRDPASVLVRAWEDGRALAPAWLEHWHSLWPEPEPALEHLLRLAQDTLQKASREEAALTALHLEPALRRAYRHDARAPAGLVAYLALSWLQLLRLRGALLLRRLELT